MHYYEYACIDVIYSIAIRVFELIMTLTAFNGEPVVWDSSLEDKLSTKFGFLARRVEKQVRNKDEKIKDIYISDFIKSGH